MRFWFDEQKTAEAVALLLKSTDGLHARTILSVLYWADRRALLEHGSPITGDQMIAMDHGPALSRVLSFLTFGPPRGSYWDRYMQSTASWCITLKPGVEPETDSLSRYEVRVLQETSQTLYLDQRPPPEWKDPQGSILPIDFATILRLSGVSEEVIQSIGEDAEYRWAIQSFCTKAVTPSMGRPE